MKISDIKSACITSPWVTCNNSPWVERKRIVPKFRWVDGHPAGYTDDLGIIADRDQWVDEVSPGWYSAFEPQEYSAMREWCEKNLKHGDWHFGVHHVILQNDADVTWFMLRWM